VESLSSGFSTRIRPVLTHARQTAVHGQLRDLAEFVLAQRAAAPAVVCCRDGGEPSVLARRRQVETCPVCAERAPDGPGHSFFDLRSRRRGALHAACFRAVLRDGETSGEAADGGLLVLELSGPGLVDEAAQLLLHRFDDGNRLVATEQIGDPTAAPFKELVEGATGRGWHEQRREWIFLTGAPQAPPRAWSAPSESQRRRNLLRVLFYS
jgi:hypothetical protein